MAGKNYKYYQPNDKDLKNKYGDCVIRAFTKATGKEWLQVFEELVSYAREYQCLPCGKTCYERFLKENGFTYTGISNKKGSKRPIVEEFSRKHNIGIYILITANHLVCVVDGIYFDTCDSGKKSMYGYWKK